MPAPIMAPTPSAVSWTAPRLRFKLCSRVSWASPSSMLMGFLTNKEFPVVFPSATAAPSSSDLVLLMMDTSLVKTSCAGHQSRIYTGQAYARTPTEEDRRDQIRY